MAVISLYITEILNFVMETGCMLWRKDFL